MKINKNKKWTKNKEKQKNDQKWTKITKKQTKNEQKIPKN